MQSKASAKGTSVCWLGQLDPASLLINSFNYSLKEQLAARTYEEINSAQIFLHKVNNTL